MAAEALAWLDLSRQNRCLPPYSLQEHLLAIRVHPPGKILHVGLRVHQILLDDGGGIGFPAGLGGTGYAGHTGQHHQASQRGGTEPLYRSDGCR